MCVFQVEVAEQRAFFRWKWLKNVLLQVEVAEQPSFFLGGSG
jgi:hypothetical protein